MQCPMSVGNPACWLKMTGVNLKLLHENALDSVRCDWRFNLLGEAKMPPHSRVWRRDKRLWVALFHA